MRRPLGRWSFLATALVLATTGAAQLPSTDVTDLVASRWRRDQDGSGFVARIGQWTSSPDGGSFSPHELDVFAARSLLPSWCSWTNTAVEAPWAGGRLDEGSLRVLVGLLTEVDPEDLAVRAFGRRRVLAGGLPERTAGALARLRRMMPGVVEVELRLERVREDEREVLVEAREQFGTGAPRVFGDRVSRALVRDLECEIAGGGAWIYRPVIGADLTGAQVALRARNVPLTDLVVVECIARDLQEIEAAPIDFARVAGPIERIEHRVGETALSFVVARGERVVHRWGDAEGVGWELQLRIGGERGEAAGEGLRILASHLLRTGPIGFHSAVVAEDEVLDRDADRSVALLSHRLEQEQRRQPGVYHRLETGFVLGGGNGVAVIDESLEGQRLCTSLAARFAATYEAVAVAVELLDVPAERGDLEDPEPSRRLAAFRGRVLFDHGATFSSLHERTILYDVDAEIAGGGGRVLDPSFAVFETGWVANLTALRPVGQLPLRLDLDLTLNLPVELRSREITLSAETVQHIDYLVPPPRIPADVVRLESPHLRRFELDRMVEFGRDGRFEATYRAASLLPADRRLLLRVRIERLDEPSATAR